LREPRLAFRWRGFRFTRFLGCCPHRQLRNSSERSNRLGPLGVELLAEGSKIPPISQSSAAIHGTPAWVYLNHPQLIDLWKVYDARDTAFIRSEHLQKVWLGRIET